ncbi:predicted protein [Histoplasma capsulatum var. duboisii H88]|uniref:Predicted protein n=1 Tax=Ajellomyces capsulatus (strain H88) TaxID=544711 RepID=F0UGL3_AJEC8|nr:predicted protein [Histoplasma capsulatum var. duboisii H88]
MKLKIVTSGKQGLKNQHRRHANIHFLGAGLTEVNCATEHALNVLVGTMATLSRAPNILCCFHVDTQGTLKPQIAERNTLSPIINEMKSKMTGYFHLDNKGILRSFDKNNKVIDYKRLSKEDYTRISKWYLNKDELKLLSRTTNFDSLVDENEIWNPSQELISSSITSEESESSSDTMKLKSKNINILSRTPAPLCTMYYCRSNDECTHQDPRCEHCLKSQF